jgi:hypothetical protein
MRTFLFAYLIMVQGAFAAQCPWSVSSAEELAGFDSDQSYDRSLSPDQVKEDLSCLKIIFENFYVGQLGYPNVNLIGRIDKEISKSGSTTSKELMKRMFKLHHGMADIHLVYKLWSEPESGLSFKPSSKLNVTLAEDLEKEKIIEREKYIYFRPGSLITFSQPQRSFINKVQVTDKNLVIDLRGNPGGENFFGFALASALHTKDQKIPVATRIQVNSIFQRIGFGVTLLILEHEQAENYWNKVKSDIQGLKFEQILPYNLERETEIIRGKRVTPFRSQVVLLTDGGCISACETVVEKLVNLPNVRRLGANTAGGIHFSNAMTFMLPNSGIITSIPSLYYQYEADAPETVGYPVHELRSYIKLDEIFN